MSELKKSKLKTSEDNKGWFFIIPLLAGLLFFFLIPFVNSIVFSLSTVTAGENGYVTDFVKFKNYYTALFVEPEFLKVMTESLLNMVMMVPLVVIFSFFMATVLNQSFKGRTVFRVILFLPVIISSFAMLSVNAADVLQNNMNGGGLKNTFSGGGRIFTQMITDYLQQAQVSQGIINTINATVTRIYSVINYSGIQILIFLTGLQSVSPSLYEASSMEGATPWENFWKITFPMVSPLILTCTVYTVIESFTGIDNKVMETVKIIAFKNHNFGLSTAMSMIYFLLVSVILSLVFLIISKKVFYYDK